MCSAHAGKTPQPGAGFRPIQWVIPAIIVAIMLLVGALGDAGRLELRFDREALAAGQWWRLVSGHLVHLGWAHLGMNALGLGLVWLLTGTRFTTAQWLLVIAVTICGMDAALWWLSPQLDWYVGLSGVLHGMLFAGLAAGLRSAPGESLVIAALVAAKIGFEQVVGPLPGSESTAGGPVVVDAHLYGAVAGLAAALPLIIGVSARRAI